MWLAPQVPGGRGGNAHVIAPSFPIELAGSAGGLPPVGSVCVPSGELLGGHCVMHDGSGLDRFSKGASLSVLGARVPMNGAFCRQRQIVRGMASSSPLPSCFWVALIRSRTLVQGLEICCVLPRFSVVQLLGKRKEPKADFCVCS